VFASSLGAIVTQLLNYPIVKLGGGGIKTA